MFNHMWLVATLPASTDLENSHTAKSPIGQGWVQGYPLWIKSVLLHFFWIILKMTNFAETF